MNEGMNETDRLTYNSRALCDDNIPGLDGDD